MKFDRLLRGLSPLSRGDLSSCSAPVSEEIKTIIMAAAEHFDGLRREASYALEVERDPDGYRALLVERAMVVTELPELLKPLIGSLENCRLRTALQEQVDLIVKEAQDALDSSDVLRLVVLLSARRAKGRNRIVDILKIFAAEEQAIAVEISA